MKSKQFKIGKTVIEISAPFEIVEQKPFFDFECFNQKIDYSVTYEVSEKLPDINTNIVFQDDVYTVKSFEGKNYIYYYDFDSKDFYACRISSDDEDFCRVVVKKDYENRMWTRLIFDTIGIEEILAKNNAVLFHSSFIDLDGQGLLFTGPCGMGKSTQADLWKKYNGTEIMNGDKSVLYENDSEYWVSGVYNSGSSIYCENVQMPIKAIVMLSQAPYNKVEKSDSLNAFLHVYKSCYPVPYSAKLMNNQMNLAEKISHSINVFKLECLPDEGAVRCLERILND